MAIWVSKEPHRSDEMRGFQTFRKPLNPMVMCIMWEIDKYDRVHVCPPLHGIGLKPENMIKLDLLPISGLVFNLKKVTLLSV